MRIIHQALASSSDLPPGKQITLFAERRQFLKRRWRGVANDGTEFGFDLETRLSDGCVIFQQDDRDYIVCQLPETVYRVICENPGKAALVGWKVGNLHLPAEVLEDAIHVLHDEAMAQLLEREGWEYSEPKVIFTPMKAIAHTS